MDIISVLVITFLLLPVIFLVLFIVFLNQSIRRGKRIKELEKEISILRQGNPGQTVPDAYATYAVPQNPMPQQNPVPQQNSVPQQGMMPGYAQPQYISLPEIQPQGYIQPQVQTAAPVPQTQNEIPGQAPAPSWALSPAQAQAERIQAAQTQAVEKETEPKKKFFSSINITFGIGVLLLTIVGATFMTGSWPWMTEGIRAICLVMIVFIVYGMSFLAGKILKLQQTEFALYTLASLLGPIVIVGMGTFNLLGSAFSFSGGNGWLVATVAALVLTITSVGGRLLFKEKTQANIYQGTFYIALTWLVIFLCGQIGQAGSGIGEWGMICLGLATLALVFRIIAITDILEGEAFFKIYSEIITYIPAGLLLCSLFVADGAIFGATIIEFAAFVLMAKFTKGREWTRYLVPFVGLMILGSWIVFADSTEDTLLIISIMVVILILLYAVHKILSLSTVMSDILFTVLLGAVPAFYSVEEMPVMGVVSCFLAVLLILFQMILEPVLAEKSPVPEGIFRKENGTVLDEAFSILATVFYYSGMVMLFLTIEEFPLKGHLYFTLAALIPAVIFLAVRAFVKDDLKISVPGFVLSVVSVFAALISCITFEMPRDSASTEFYMNLRLCSWVLTFTVIIMSMFFMVRPLKEKRLSPGVMFWASVILNAFSIGVFMTIGCYDEISRSAEGTRSPEIILAVKIAVLTFLALNIVTAGAASILKRKGKQLVADYAAGMKYFFVGFAILWFTVAGMVFDTAWHILIISVIFAILLAVFDSEFFSVIPIFVAEYATVYEYMRLENSDLVNILCVASALACAGLGRLIFRKNVISSKAVDYLSLTSFMFLFGVDDSDYVIMMIFLALALIVLNLAGRVRIPSRTIVSVFAALVCFAVVAQPFFTYPDIISLEIKIVLLLGTLLLICKVIRPAQDNVMKYFWFSGVALSLIAEGISAAVTGEVLDLIIVGTASFGIFIYAFIRRNRLWFILGIVSMISVAVYLSVAFWSSLVWLIYLFVAGTILVVMASVNEWGKRHNKDGKKRRFFEEWTW